ncbi:hypothetical protein GW17_00000602 [Ensete ventricosum]|uniref:Uncharacterized protein n=1 Tax=Ensete ventricosum TaxID=4639 RepID=A0A444GIF2_ENSVE|nr:hypothetical protein GW17_00000602 [Ensete ventricosum]RZR70936.1 hypothetical protein BHM03_00002437 [Ensete ventricosum]
METCRSPKSNSRGSLSNTRTHVSVGSSSFKVHRNLAVVGSTETHSSKTRHRTMFRGLFSILIWSKEYYKSAEGLSPSSSRVFGHGGRKQAVDSMLRRPPGPKARTCAYPNRKMSVELLGMPSVPPLSSSEEIAINL